MSLAVYLNFLWSIKFWFTLLFALFLHSVIRTWILWKRMPPGPFPLPFLGNMLLFRGTKVGTHETFLELSKKFGDSMTIFFMNTPCVVLTKFELAKSILSQTTFSSRHDSALMQMVFEDSQDLGAGKYGPIWQFHRKAVTKCMRTIIEAEKLEYKVLGVVDDIVKNMIKAEVVEPKLHMRHIVFNIITSLAFGKTYKIDDPEFIRLNWLSENTDKEFTKLYPLEFLPFAKYLPLKRLPSVKRDFLPIIDEFQSVRLRNIKEHRETYIKGELRDFCDAILSEQKILQEERPDEAYMLTDDHLSWIIMDFFSAGIDTTTAVLNWFFLFMVIHPELQEKCYQLIKEEIGDKPPKLSDRAKLPFMEACIMETLRFRPVSAVGLPHAPTCDTKIGDYFIPEGAMIMPNIYAMHVDPEHWEKPLEFNPQLHFLDEADQLKRPTSFAPFGFGRRVCVGEQLAKNDLFLVATRILQQVRFEPLEGVEYNENYDIEIDLAILPLPFSIRVVPRSL